MLHIINMINIILCMYIFKTQLHYLVNNVLRNITFLLEFSVRYVTYLEPMSVFSPN